jgi:hypothetical protein
MSETLLVSTGAVFVAAAALLLQVIDAIAALVDMRRLGDDDEPDGVTRTRFRDLAWTLAVTAAIAVFVAYGADSAARLAGAGQALGGLLLLGAAGIGAFLVGLVGVVAILRREKPTYARIRRDLRDRSTATFTPEELDAFAARLRRADVLRARRPIGATVLRIVGLIVVLAVTGPGAVIGFVSGHPGAAWSHVAAGLLGLVAFCLALRARTLRRSAVEGVFDAQRAEVEALLERARIPRPGRVPGLRDRVSRALAILREKQR